MQREFGLTRIEFLRSLRHLTGADGWRERDGGFLLQLPFGQVEIHLGDAGCRRIGALSLPVLPVEFRFSGVDDEQRAAFLRRFERAFQRGGG